MVDILGRDVMVVLYTDENGAFPQRMPEQAWTWTLPDTKRCDIILFSDYVALYPEISQEKLKHIDDQINWTIC